MKQAFELSEDVEKLIGFLMTRQRATYAEMSELIDRDIKGRARYVLQSARRMLERNGVFFGVERKIGLVRATNGQVATLSTSYPIKKIRNTTRVAQRRQRHVNLQGLTSEQRLAFDVGRSVIEAMRNNTSKALRTKLAQEIQRRDGGVVNITSVLALPRHRKDQ